MESLTSALFGHTKYPLASTYGREKENKFLKRTPSLVLNSIAENVQKGLPMVQAQFTFIASFQRKSSLYQPLLANLSPSGIFSTFRPTMASPKSMLTSANTLGSL